MATKSWGEKIQENAKTYNISQRTFFNQGSHKIKGKPLSTVVDEVNSEVAQKMKKYGLESDFRRYIRVMKNAKDEAKNQPVLQPDGSVVYTDDTGNICYVDGDAVDEIYRNELAEENAIDSIVEKCLVSDTVCRIILGTTNYNYLQANVSVTPQLLQELNDNTEVSQAEARPMMLRCIDPKSKAYSTGITKLRAIVKICRPVLEYKSQLANGDISQIQGERPKFDTGMEAKKPIA